MISPPHFSTVPAKVLDPWHGAKPKSELQEQILTMLAVLEIKKPIAIRRKPQDLINESKELLLVKSKSKLLELLQKNLF